MTADFVHNVSPGFIQGAPDLLDPKVLGMPLTGTAWYLDPTNGSDSNSGRSASDAFATLPTAYAALTAGQHDTLFYIAGSSSITLSAAFTWSKDYTHFIGVCAPNGVGNRARIFQLAASAISPLITVSGDGCIFYNIYTFQGVDEATSLINWLITGERNFFSNMHFAGGGHATNAVDGCSSLTINGGGENRFVRCTFGVDTIAAATGVACLSFTDAGATARNVFEDCNFTIQAGDTAAMFIESLGNTSTDRYQLFKRCTFINDAEATALASAIVAPATNGPKWWLFQDCMFVQVTKVDADDRALVYGNMNAYTAADLGGVAVLLNV